MKDLIIKALTQTEPFLEHDGELYKKFSRIEIAPAFKTITKREKLGLFRSETTEERVYCGIAVKLMYGDTVVKERYFENIDITNGDMLNIAGEIAGVMRVSIDDAN